MTRALNEKGFMLKNHLKPVLQLLILAKAVSLPRKAAATRKHSNNKQVTGAYQSASVPSSFHSQTQNVTNRSLPGPQPFSPSLNPSNTFSDGKGYSPYSTWSHNFFGEATAQSWGTNLIRQRSEYRQAARLAPSFTIPLPVSSRSLPGVEPPKTEGRGWRNAKMAAARRGCQGGQQSLGGVGRRQGLCPSPLCP